MLANSWRMGGQLYRLGRTAFVRTCQRQTNFSFTTQRHSTTSTSCSKGMATTSARTLLSKVCYPISQIGMGSRAMIQLPSQCHMTMLQTGIAQRPFSSCRQCLCEKTTKEVANTQRQASHDPILKVAASEHHQHFSARHATDFDKKLLVYFGKYKSTEEVPQLVSVHLLNSTRNRFRVYVNIFIGFLTMSGCAFMMYRGHQRAGKGESLAHHNMMRHPEHYRKQLKG